MAASIFDQPRFKDPDAAREHLESIRWPNGPICPHCGAVDRISKLNGNAHRPGVYDCGHCRDQFTVTVGTVFERSHIPLHKWLMAATLIVASKKGISSHQLHRMLGVTYKTAWFMSHRLREAMKPSGSGLLGGGGKIVEADETFFGKIEGAKVRAHGGSSHKHKLFALVEREGSVRSFHVANVAEDNLKPIMMAQLAKDTHLMTDGAHQYKNIGRAFKHHESVNHTQGEYAKKSRKVKGVTAHTNTVESYFGLLKRGLVGTYHHVSEQHLQRYISEFDFRFSNRASLGITDVEREAAALKGISGKRLTYRRTDAH